jgi:excisionase family DNA binding protein
MTGPGRKNKRTNQNAAASTGTEAVRLLTVKEAADRTQTSERHLRRMIKDDLLPVTRLGKAVRIHPKDLGL